MGRDAHVTLGYPMGGRLANHGIPFLGYRVFPFGFKLKKTSLKRFRRKISDCERLFAEGLIDEDELANREGALTAFAARGTSVEFRNGIFKKYGVSC